jgi:hypothetical protein
MRNAASYGPAIRTLNPMSFVERGLAFCGRWRFRRSRLLFKTCITAETNFRAGKEKARTLTLNHPMLDKRHQTCIFILAA